MEFKAHPKERTYFVIMVAISMVMYAALAAFLYVKREYIGTFLLYSLSFLLMQWIGSYFFLGHLRGNALRVTKHQFPAIYEITKQYAEKLGIAVPTIYMLQSHGVLNAFAVKLARKNFIVLHSDVMQLVYENKVDAVAFIIGHELGHIKRKHVYRIPHALTLPARLLPFLGKAHSRACEYTCDNIAFSLCPEGAIDGIALLAAGPKLFKQINLGVLETAGFTITFAELFSTHPALVRRLESLHEMRQQLQPKQEGKAPSSDRQFMPASKKENELSS